MSTLFSQEVLKIVVAQICQVVGFQGICTVPMEVLIDLLHRYILKIAVSTKSYAEHCGRTEPCLADLNLSFQDLGVSVSDLEEYVNHVDPYPFPHEIPKFPIPRPSNMNFLKPGSKETLSRPIHIHEHLPPMYPEKEEEDDNNMNTNESFDEEQCGGLHSPLSGYNDKILADGDDYPTKRSRYPQEEEGQPVREVDSVMMTTSGFISSARAGKLPEARRPNVGMPSIHRDPSILKKRATMEKIIRHKSQQVGIHPGPLAKPRPDLKLKPKLPAAPPGTGSLKVGKVAPILKMPTPKKLEENVDKEVEKIKLDKREEHRHKDRRRDRGKSSRDEKERGKGRMRMRGLSKEEELRRYKQREQELIAALAASASVTVTSIPPPSLRVREKTPDKDATGKVSPDVKKLAVLKKVSVKELPEKLKSPTNLIDVQNIKEEKPDEDEYPTTPHSFMEFNQMSLPLTPKTPEKIFSPGQVDHAKTKSKPRNPSSKNSKRHSKGSSRRRKNIIPAETKEFVDRTAEASLEVKSPPREFLAFPNAPSHIPSFSSFSYPNFGPPQADIKPFANVFPDTSFSSTLPLNESITTTCTETDDFERSLENVIPYREEPLEPLQKMTTPLPKLEKKKEHKKDRKSKVRDVEKEKAKKKKKDKERAKEEKKKEKEKQKEEKRRKKKEKEEAAGIIPKITLKLQPEEPSRVQPVETKPTPKLVIKPVVKRPDEYSDENRPHYSSFSAQTIEEPGSPEIAKLTALITRPSKSSSKKHSDRPTVPPLKIKDAVKKSEKKDRKRKRLPDSPKPQRIIIPPVSSSSFPSPRSPDFSNPKPSKRHTGPTTALISETVGPIGCFKDDLGNEVWICPTCGKQDDGSPMIGCDTCDDWYHWVCVGIQVAPNENVNWYCPRCISQKNRGFVEKKKRGRKRKIL